MISYWALNIQPSSLLTIRLIIAMQMTPSSFLQSQIMTMFLWSVMFVP